MRKSELEKAKEYEAKAKEIRRKEKAFWDDVKERKDEVAKFLGLTSKPAPVNPRWGNLAEAVGLNEDKLFALCASERFRKLIKSFLAN